eukprot:352661-Chlamydomonas_euryale.AAC.2
MWRANGAHICGQARGKDVGQRSTEHALTAIGHPSAVTHPMHALTLRGSERICSVNTRHVH